MELWIHSNELPNDIKEEIMSNMSHILEGNEEFDEELAMKIKSQLRKPYIKEFFLFLFLLLLLFCFIDRFKSSLIKVILLQSCLLVI